MKIAVEMTAAEIREMHKVTRQRRRGDAVRQLALEALKLKKRHALSDRILAREWSVDLPDLGALREERGTW